MTESFFVSLLKPLKIYKFLIGYCTFLPNSSSKERRFSEVMVEETWAVMTDININPTIIHSEAYTRASVDFGVLSP